LAGIRGNCQNSANPHESKDKSSFRLVLSVSRQIKKMAAVNFISRSAAIIFRPNNFNLNPINL